jgi:hypothetical protein
VVEADGRTAGAGIGMIEAGGRIAGVSVGVVEARGHTGGFSLGVVGASIGMAGDGISVAGSCIPALEWGAVSQEPILSRKRLIGLARGELGGRQLAQAIEQRTSSAPASRVYARRRQGIGCAHPSLHRGPWAAQLADGATVPGGEKRLRALAPQQSPPAHVAGNLGLVGDDRPCGHSWSTRVMGRAS